ncbi:SDR family NAD(P)-dependent oxidoreductase [Glutamicibacter creatinolyticus]|uniref:SDR family NAD(P)-dependent oxidoreductase n=1 Tax=Glutamicibacter creatinolyticus TaxID=162496 RepID=UPI003B97FE7D
MTRKYRHGAVGLLGHGEPADTVHANRERWNGWGQGKTALVTGGNAGLGFFTALGLAASGAQVIIASRSMQRSRLARELIEQLVPGSRIRQHELDTSSYASVDRLGRDLASVELDIIVANAGLIHTPRQRQVGVDGHELTLATNFLGHARLIGSLAEQFRQRQLRLIGLGSMSTRMLPADPQNLELHHGYSAYRAYTQSKAALQCFTMALDHRLKQLSWPARSLAVHPGYSISGLSIAVPGINEPTPARRWRDQLQSGFAQGKHQGAVPIIEAALNPGIAATERGAYFGPALLSKGRVRMVKPSRLTRSKKLLDPVWELYRRANDGTDPFGL